MKLLNNLDNTDFLNKIIRRKFTKELEKNKNLTVYDLFNWKLVDVFLKDHKTGKVLVDMKDLEFPEHYSQNSCDIIASKYFRKAGVHNKYGYENSMKMVAHRMVNFWASALHEQGLLKTKDEKQIFYDEMVYALLSQMYAPNSPQWFNTGLCMEYGIKGSPNGNYYYDENLKQVVESVDSYSRTQASACFILSIEDKLLGSHSISDQYVNETKLFKGGSGTGTNFSTIRAKGEKLSGGGVSSGLMSFLKGLDRNAGAIKSGGTTRRAAKMVCLDIDHPEILDFITWKAREEDKVRALGKMGYDMDIDGEAYETVSGQNSNNSIRFSDFFMEKVKNLDSMPDDTIELEGRVDSSVNQKVKVKDLWDSFAKSTWMCADPAPQFSDTFNAWHTCPAGEDGNVNAKHNKINSTNPCGEYAFLDNSSCNLASINIYKFYDGKEKNIDLESYLHVVGLVQLALEASIYWGQFPTKDIAQKTYMFRATGLGITNLASLLMVLGYPYNSTEARNISSALVGLLTGYSYYISSLMAKEIGTFEKFSINKPHMLKVIRNHAKVAGSINGLYEDLNYNPVKVDHNLLENIGFSDLSNLLKKSWLKALNSGEEHGYRNAQVSVIAPTGTISFAMDCGATSIEPFFSHVVYKKLSGGGMMTVTNPVIELSLKNLGYSKEQIKDILQYVLEKEVVQTKEGFKYEKVLDGKIEGAPHLKKEHYAIFDTANKCGSGKRYIEPMGHVKMVAALTPLISGAISKTVNLPNNATIEDFKKVILNSWELGVKGIALYRDGCKASQPLNVSLSSEKDFELEDLDYKSLLEKSKELQRKLQEGVNYSSREKAIGIRNGTTHPAQINDVKIYTTINRRQNGEISEIYITTDREGTIIMGLLNSLSKALSIMLQYHVPPQDISKMLRGQKYEPYGFVQKHPYIKYVSSISDLISKIIDIEVGDFSRCQVKPENYDLNTNARNVFNTNDIIKDQFATNSPNYISNQSKDSNNNDNSASDNDLASNNTYKTVDGKAVAGERLYCSTCPTCSSTRMVRNGTCLVCLDCGSTTGCS
ncbi:vitamin B12-dependent ribonucleotide reductase [Clostridium tetani]|uniref:vitamin B12-dependent ribonucleotide reductase n=1 Tax=Clostridium tetani TaxID=1513 RepID=UPI000627F433|nr:vitamin B12-dependent ribonucleotide reductase [Clostridium tetani]RXI67409.1 vitamin B12-dependent ribonucleotide reductase [Clostridium tetani]BDR74745.1 vitamin B12-dependent ribonucleotide reductase [Clostridium tetani]BDR85791.1 vitamin B12-dependent ribonucleotide reductase [Clostridium tetani]